MRIDFGECRDRKEHSQRIIIASVSLPDLRMKSAQTAGYAAVGEARIVERLRLRVNNPCGNLNNCPGFQEGIGEVLCPLGLASTRWRSSVGRASDL